MRESISLEYLWPIQINFTVGTPYRPGAGIPGMSLSRESRAVLTPSHAALRHSKCTSKICRSLQSSYPQGYTFRASRLVAL